MRLTTLFASFALLALPLATGCAAGPVEDGQPAELAEGEEAFVHAEVGSEAEARGPGAGPSIDLGGEPIDAECDGRDEPEGEELPGGGDLGELDGRTPESASTTLYGAWLRGDRELARSVASAGVVSELFAVSSEGAAWSFDGCIAEGEGFACGFWYEGGYAGLRVEDAGQDEHVVTTLAFSAD